MSRSEVRLSAAATSSVCKFREGWRMEKGGLGIFTPFQCVTGDAMSDVPLGLMIIFDAILDPVSSSYWELIPVFTWV